MKKITFVGLTEEKTFIVQEKNDYPKELTFQGFIINNSLKFRHHFDSLIGKQIQGTINKKSQTLRYQDFELFKRLLQAGAIQIQNKQLEDSQLYSQQQKTKLKLINQTIKNDEQKEAQLIQINDYVSNRKALLTKFRSKKVTSQMNQQKCQIQGVFLEYLADQIVLRIQQVHTESKSRIITYIPIQLKNLDHYFQSIQKKDFSEFITKFRSIQPSQIFLDGVYYNLDRKQYRLKAIFPREMQFQIIKAGWATVSLFNVVSIPAIYLNEIKSLQHTARKSHLGIFKPVFEMLSLIYTKNNLVGTVEDVLDGYIYEIRSHSDQNLLKVQLTNIYCPIGDEPGAFEAREFARKNLIGKQVNVFLKKNQGLNMHGSISRISDGKDLQNLMLQNGWAYVKQQIKGSLLAAKFENLEIKAKQKSKGLHKKQLKQVGVVRFKDLSKAKIKTDYEDNVYLQNRLAFLNSFSDNQEGVIQEIYDALNYRVRFDSKKVIIKMKLQGIRSMQLNPVLPEYQELKKQIHQFLNKNFKKRTVQVSLNDYQKHGNAFVGTIKYGQKFKKDFQESLLEESFVYCEVNYIKPEYMKIQQAKAKQGNRLWQQKLLPFMPKRMLDEQPHEFNGKVSWVQNGQTIFIQPASKYEKIDQISTILNQKKLQPLKKLHLQIGVICAAPYGQDQVYRARIISVKNKNVKVKFIDWGNTQQVVASSLTYLPQSLLYVQRQCVEAKLNFVKPLKGNYQCLEKVREELMQGQLQFEKFIGDSVNAYKGKEFLNIQFIEKGLLKADSSKFVDEALLKDLRQIQENLRKARAGVWEFSDKEGTSSENQEQYEVVIKGNQLL